MGQRSHRLGILLPGSSEDHRFHGYFGVSAEVAVEAWKMMEELDYLPSLPQFQHNLWALAFMRLYPANNIALLATLGGSDPKTIRKYIWPNTRFAWAGGTSGQEFPVFFKHSFTSFS